MPSHILVVDDEPSLCGLTVRMLVNAGFSAHELGSGSAALQLLCRGGRADAAIVDIRMPGISGFALARAIWDSRPELPILFTSGYPDPDRKISDTPLQLCDFLPKPYNSEQLIMAVRRILPESQPA